MQGLLSIGWKMPRDQHVIREVILRAFLTFNRRNEAPDRSGDNPHVRM